MNANPQVFRTKYAHCSGQWACSVKYFAKDYVQNMCNIHYSLKYEINISILLHPSSFFAFENQTVKEKTENDKWLLKWLLTRDWLYKSEQAYI